MLFCNSDNFSKTKFLGNTKLIVIGGAIISEGPTSNVEVIDLEISTSECSGIPDFPSHLISRFGGLSSKGPFVCGGVQYVERSLSSNCYYFDEEIWKRFSTLNDERLIAAICPSFVMDDYQFIVAGGFNHDRDVVNTTEVLTDEGWKITLPDLPETAYLNCMVKINSTTVMAIFEENTYFMTNIDQKWVPGPKLNQTTLFASCAILNQNSSSHEKIVILVKDDTDTSLSVEILDNGASHWRNGPRIPFYVPEPVLVEDHLGGVILVGAGPSDESYDINSLYRLANAGNEAQWKELPQKLKHGRSRLTAILIPDTYVTCKLN